MQSNGVGLQFDAEVFRPLIEQAVEAAMIRLEQARATVGGNRGALDMTPASASSPLALRPREAAKVLGVSARLLWQLTKDGIVPCVRVGRGKRQTVLYPVMELQAWLTRQTTMTKKSEHEMNLYTGQLGQ